MTDRRHDPNHLKEGVVDPYHHPDEKLRNQQVAQAEREGQQGKGGRGDQGGHRGQSERARDQEGSGSGTLGGDGAGDASGGRSGNR